jgi:hypothetical protein
MPQEGGPLRIEQPSEEGPTRAVYFVNSAPLSSLGLEGSPHEELPQRRPPLLIELVEEEGPASMGLAAWVHKRGHGPGWTNALH